MLLRSYFYKMKNNCLIKPDFVTTTNEKKKLCYMREKRNLFWNC